MGELKMFGNLGMMTKKKAKELTILMWTYLAEHPKITEKNELPEELYRKIKHLCNECPLCELFLKKGDSCDNCPLRAAGNFCSSGNSFYYLWRHAGNPKLRSAAAWGIVNIVKEWKI
jgi:hypothetical protein